MNLSLKSSPPGTETDLRSASNRTPSADPFKTEPDSAADFSRLLARQLSGSRKEPAQAADGDPRKRTVENEPLRTREQESRESRVEVPDTERNATSAADEGKQKAVAAVSGEATAEAAVVSLEDALTAHLGTSPLPGLSSPVITQSATPVGIEGISVDIRSKMAGEIAARFTDRNGTQTLTLKLDAGKLGPVEARLQAKGNHLTVRFTAGDKEAETALRGSMKELSDSIQERSGRFHQVEVRVDLKMAEDQAKRNPGDAPGHPDEGHREQKNQENREQTEDGHHGRTDQQRSAPHAEDQGG